MSANTQTYDIKINHYRNYSFDGKVHVYLEGVDIHKIESADVTLSYITSTEELYRQDTKYYSEHHRMSFSRVKPGAYKLDCSVLPKRLQNNIEPGIINLESKYFTIHPEESTRHILDGEPIIRSTPHHHSHPNARPTRGAKKENIKKDINPINPINLEDLSVVIKFTPGGYDELLSEPTTNNALGNYFRIRSQLLFHPFFPPEIQEEEAELQHWSETFSLEFRAIKDIALLSKALQDLNTLDYVEYIEPLLNISWSGARERLSREGAEVSSSAKTSDFSNRQNYLLGDDTGLNVLEAWKRIDTPPGKGVRIHMTEEAFPTHEDLENGTNAGQGEIVAAGLDFPASPYPASLDQANAFAGLLLAQNNKIGITGLAYGATLFVYTGLGDFIKDMLGKVKAGDIVCFPHAFPILNPDGELSLDGHAIYYASNYFGDVIDSMIRLGASVFATGGYGAADLSYFPERSLGPGGGFKKSRAVTVGAFNPRTHLRMDDSNFNFDGGRLCSWGDAITTLGYGQLQNYQGTERDYTSHFGGGGATVLVTGAAALIQSYALSRYHVYLNMDNLYSLLNQTGNDTAAGQGIGVQPDVEQALIFLDRRMKDERNFTHPFDVDILHYRNFNFDEKLHVRAKGADLKNVQFIQIALYALTPDSSALYSRKQIHPNTTSATITFDKVKPGKYGLASYAKMANGTVQYLKRYEIEIDASEINRSIPLPALPGVTLPTETGMDHRPVTSPPRKGNLSVVKGIKPTFTIKFKPGNPRLLKTSIEKKYNVTLTPFFTEAEIKADPDFERLDGYYLVEHNLNNINILEAAKDIESMSGVDFCSLTTVSNPTAIFDVDVMHYRSFQFDEKLHVRARGSDLDKTDVINIWLNEYKTGFFSIHSRKQIASLSINGMDDTATFDKVKPGKYRLFSQALMKSGATQELTPYNIEIEASEKLQTFLSPEDFAKKNSDELPAVSSSPKGNLFVVEGKKPDFSVKFKAGNYVARQTEFSKRHQVRFKPFFTKAEHEADSDLAPLEGYYLVLNELDNAALLKAALELESWEEVEFCSLVTTVDPGQQPEKLDTAHRMSQENPDSSMENQPT